VSLGADARRRDGRERSEGKSHFSVLIAGASGKKTGTFEEPPERGKTGRDGRGERRAPAITDTCKTVREGQLVHTMVVKGGFSGRDRSNSNLEEGWGEAGERVG